MVSLGTALSGIFSGAHKGGVVGIDIGTSAIKIVEVEKKDERAVLKNYGEIILGPRAGATAGQATNLPPSELGKALTDLLHEMGTAPKRAYFAIPFSASLLSVIEVPDVGRKELEGMIPLEARRYIPVPLSEVSLDWWVLPKQKEAAAATSTPGQEEGVREKVEVILAAIHNDVLRKYEEIERGARIAKENANFEIEIFSTLRAVVGRDLAPIVVVDIGAGSTKLALVESGVVRGSHVISVGGQDITLALAKSLKLPLVEAEELKCRVGITGDEEGRDVALVADLMLTNIVNETTRFIEAYERRYGITVEKIVLVGGGARLKGIEKAVTTRFPKVSITVGDAFARLDAPAFLASTLKDLSPNFAVAIGLALKGLEE